MDALPLTAETLLEHEHFVRSVARGLLRDNDAVGDVVQETWLRGLEHRPHAGNLRGWLGRVAGNLARDRRRGSARRALREERAARSEAAESVHVSFERLSLQRDVVTAILALDEPYRTVVLLRYHHDLEPQAIAERLGVKPATVRTQLVRAHELLRAKLDSRYGRESWAALLLPIALPAPGAGAMTGIALGLGTALAALWLVISYGPAQREPVTPSADEGLALLPTEELDEELGLDAGASTRVAVTETPAPGALGAPGAGDGRETLGPRAELLARSRYDDYERATFSFEFGVRDDPTGVLGNDWDVEYNGREFDARTIVNDTSVIVDLGEVPVRELWAWNGALGRTDERVPVHAGHSYFLWSRDPDTDLAVAFEVVELVPEDQCVLDWYATSDGQHARGSFEDESPGKTLARRLLALRSELRKPGELRDAHVLLQGRNGSRGGANPHRVDIAGGTSYFDSFSPEALDVTAPLTRNEASLAHGEGGFVPEGEVFVVTSATYWATAPEAEGKPRDEAFALVIGGQRVVADPLAQPLSGTWVGRIEIPPGEEALTYLELKYACAGEVELFGELVERPGLIARARPSPPRQPREPKPPPPVLSAPTVRLQGRNGAGGGNPFRVKMDGELSRFRTLSSTPLDLDAPIDTHERGIAFCEGGVVPEGQRFLVTSVDYYGYAKGDSNGPGGFAVVVDGQRIVEHESAEPISGTWRGRIELASLGAMRTYLEVRNSSAGEAVLRGEFVPAPSIPR